MQGLELAEAYYRNEGIPMLARDFADESGRIAVGLAGHGSECFGFDDELSRDHDWGPGFCLWLTGADYDRFGARLQAAYAALPPAFASAPPRRASQWGFGRVGVMTTGSFYAGFTGLESAPASLAQWRNIPEANLAACTNGAVFSDPLGEFSRLRQALLAFYPEDVRRHKIAARCMSAGQAGQYNYPRCLARGEHVAARYAETKFVADAISLVFLLNRRYRPFYKWMHRAMQDLPRLGPELHARLQGLVQLPDGEAKQELIEDICVTLVAELDYQGLSRKSGHFLPDHGPTIQDGIIDPNLRQAGPWAD